MICKAKNWWFWLCGKMYSLSTVLTLSVHWHKFGDCIFICVHYLFFFGSWRIFYWTRMVTSRLQTLGCVRKTSHMVEPQKHSVAHQNTLPQKWVTLIVCRPSSPSYILAFVCTVAYLGYLLFLQAPYWNFH